MEYFLKHQTVILRVVGGLFILVGFVVHFWVVPPKGISKNDLAAANLARMEASVAGSNKKQSSSKKDESTFLNELKEKQKKQLEYLTIIIMVLGALSLGSSFIKKKERD
ncbi:MAG: hypothetical protein U9O86_09065 [Campylobacterota bacterium]|nr:hypothetical protein [Campylobacterota bacterium]